MEGQRPRSRAEGPKRFAHVSLHPTRGPPAIPERVLEEDIDGPPRQGEGPDPPAPLRPQGGRGGSDAAAC